MSERNYTPDEIEDYLEGKMGDAEKAVFEATITEDKALAEMLDTFRAEKKAFRLLRSQALLEQFQSWEQEKTSLKKSPAKKWFNHRHLRVLILIMAILICGVMVLSPWFSKHNVTKTIEPDKQVAKDSLNVDGEENEADTNKIKENSDIKLNKDKVQDPKSKTSTKTTKVFAELADKYYIAGGGFGISRRNTTSTDSSKYVRAVIEFDAGRLSRALTLLQQPDSSRLDQSVYLRAHTLYKLDRYKEALTDFRYFKQVPVSDNKYDAEWCEVLCLLHLMPAERSDLFEILKKISANANHPYFGKAKSVLTDLDKLN